MGLGRCTFVFVGLLAVVSCARPPPPVTPPPSSRAPTHVVLRPAARGRVVVRPERETVAPMAAGVEPMGVRSGPAERTIQRTSPSGALGLTLACRSPDGDREVCRAILGSFRVEP